MKNKNIMDDLTGVAGSLAGLANDARNHIINKKESAKSTLKTVKDAQTILDRLDSLEARIKIIEDSIKSSSS